MSLFVFNLFLSMSSTEKTLFGSFLIVFVVGSLVFYWFSYRPTKIRQNCSWTHVFEPIVNAIPPDDSVVIPEELEMQAQFGSGFKKYNAEAEINALLEKKTGTPTKPAEDYWTEASDEEYEHCLRAQGL